MLSLEQKISTAEQHLKKQKAELQQSLGRQQKRIAQGYRNAQRTIQLKTTQVAHLDQNVEILGNGTSSLLEQFSRRTPHLSDV